MTKDPTDWNIELIKAAFAGDFASFKKALENGADINFKDKFAASIMPLFAKSNNAFFKEIISITKDKIDVNATNKQGETAIHLTINNRLLKNMKLLLDTKKVDLVYQLNNMTYIQYVIQSKELGEILLESDDVLEYVACLVEAGEKVLHQDLQAAQKHPEIRTFLEAAKAKQKYATFESHIVKPVQSIELQVREIKKPKALKGVFKGFDNNSENKL